MRKISTCGTALLCLLIGTAGAANAGLFGPPKFQVQHSDDRFSSSKAHSVFGVYNIISKKQLGYVIALGDGLFIDPLVTTSGDQKLIALAVSNHCTSYDAGKWVCVGRPETLSFITGEGEPINLSVHDGDVKIGAANYNTVTHDTSVTITETGAAELSQDDYARIMNAPTLAVKISGSDKSIVFENKVIDGNFQANLKSFYMDYIAGNKAD
jgi:hypothetical protein